MVETIIFIDGENFIHKIEEVLKNKNIKKHKIDITSVNFSGLFNKALNEFKLPRKIFYAAKLHSHPETKNKSEQLIKIQRKFRNNLINQKFEFEMQPNKGLIYTTNRTILFRNSEILEACGVK